MSRPIKFRAWDKRDKSQSERGTMLSFETMNDYDEQGLISWRDFIQSFNEEDLVLMQFTGLLDKNNVGINMEVFVGDIIGEPRVGMEPEVVGVVVGDDDLAAYVIKKTNGGWEYLGKHFVEHRNHHVVGNIHENPELLP